MQVLTGRCNLLRLKKTPASAKSSLCQNAACPIEDETPNYHEGNPSFTKLATYLKEAGRRFEFDQKANKTTVTKQLQLQ